MNDLLTQSFLIEYIIINISYSCEENNALKYSWKRIFQLIIPVF